MAGLAWNLCRRCEMTSFPLGDPKTLTTLGKYTQNNVKIPNRKSVSASGLLEGLKAASGASAASRSAWGIGEEVRNESELRAVYEVEVLRDTRLELRTGGMTSKNEEEGGEELATTTTSLWDKYRIATYEKNFKNFFKVVQWNFVLAHACLWNIRFYFLSLILSMLLELTG